MNMAALYSWTDSQCGVYCCCTDPDERSLVDHTYQAFREYLPKGVMLRDVLNGFAQVLATTPHDQAKFFFDFFDEDASGELSSGEVM